MKVDPETRGLGNRQVTTCHNALSEHAKPALKMVGNYSQFPF